MSPIVTFNVGGKHYDVSRSLLEKYPDTILTIAASEIGDDDNDHPEPIFIERDGERFRYVLDYMRNGNISLPSSVSRREFIRDLDYLGFHNLSLGSIPNDIRNPLIPDDLQYEYGVQFHQVIWDATRTTKHVRFDKSNCLVKNHDDDAPTIVFGSTGFSSGVHFWNVKILCGPCIIGVTTVNKPLNMKYFNDQWAKVATAKTDDIIGILLNMEEMYCKEYRNGQRTRTSTLQPGIQYPYAHFEGYQEIISCEIPSEKNVFHFPREQTGGNTISIPKELRCIVDIESHQITWTPSNHSPGLVLTNNNHLVKRTTAASWEWHGAQGSLGFSHGVHYWSFRIITTRKTANIMIGISSNVDTTRSYYAGKNDDGGSYFGANGILYFQQQPRSESGDISREYAPTFTNGDIIGTLLDMTHKTVTFYKNNIRCGCTTRVRRSDKWHRATYFLPHLSGDIYYPCVALGNIGDEVYSCETSYY